jgi:arginyl-tRNA synthetase
MGGDIATNIALLLAKAQGANPRQLAESLAERLRQDGGVTSVEVAGPGFLNISLTDGWYVGASGHLPQLPEEQRRHYIVEYISANPTGPLHIGNARGGPIGETICRVLQAVGHTVEREFYINDIGGQANLVAESVFHYYCKGFNKEYPFPENGYPAPYIQDIAQELAGMYGEKYVSLANSQDKLPGIVWDRFRPVVIETMVKKLADTSQKMGIHFDQWFSQSWTQQRGLSQEALKLLKEKGNVFEKDGATWLKCGQEEEDRETVLIKSDGSATYFLDDLGYHLDKLVKRGAHQAIVVLGANHFGHIPRMKSGLSAMGIDPARYEGVLYQQVQLKENGQAIKMSKREGNFVTADEVLDEVPLMVFNYFMLSKGNESHIDFDLNLAKDTSEKNPVYYVQYAHARIRSVLKLAEERGIQAQPLTGPFSKEERSLIYWLDHFPAVVEEVMQTYRVNLITGYVYELATRYHVLYAHQRIIGDDQSKSGQLTELSRLTAERIQGVLDLLNITALDHM